MGDLDAVPELVVCFGHDGAEILRMPIDVLLHVRAHESGEVTCPRPGTALYVTLRQYHAAASFTFQVPDRAPDDA